MSTPTSFQQDWTETDHNKSHHQSTPTTTITSTGSGSSTSTSTSNQVQQSKAVQITPQQQQQQSQQTTLAANSITTTSNNMNTTNDNHRKYTAIAYANSVSQLAQGQTPLSPSSNSSIIAALAATPADDDDAAAAAAAAATPSADSTDGNGKGISNPATFVTPSSHRYDNANGTTTKIPTTTTSTANNNMHNNNDYNYTSYEHFYQQQQQQQQQQDDEWNHMYSLLKEYREKNGDCYFLNPSQYPDGSINQQLSAWVKNQRRLQRTTDMTPQQRQLLDQLNFDWSDQRSMAFQSRNCNNSANENTEYQKRWNTYQPKNNHDKWLFMFEKLTAFKEEFGHVDIPIRWKRDPALGKWVSRQRETRKSLKPEYFDKLQEVGFKWRLKHKGKTSLKSPTHRDKYEAQWAANLHKLLEYRRVHGHCQIPPDYPQDDALGRWAHKQRLLFGRGELRHDRKLTLESAGFFDSKDLKAKLKAAATATAAAVASTTTSVNKQSFKGKTNAAVSSSLISTKKKQTVTPTPPRPHARLLPKATAFSSHTSPAAAQSPQASTTKPSSLNASTSSPAQSPQTAQQQAMMMVLGMKSHMMANQMARIKAQQQQQLMLLKSDAKYDSSNSISNSNNNNNTMRADENLHMQQQAVTLNSQGQANTAYPGLVSLSIAAGVASYQSPRPYSSPATAQAGSSTTALNTNPSSTPATATTQAHNFEDTTMNDPQQPPFSESSGIITVGPDRADPFAAWSYYEAGPCYDENNNHEYENMFGNKRRALEDPSAPTDTPVAFSTAPYIDSYSLYYAPTASISVSNCAFQKGTNDDWKLKRKWRLICN